MPAERVQIGRDEEPVVEVHRRIHHGLIERFPYAEPVGCVGSAAHSLPEAVRITVRKVESDQYPSVRLHVTGETRANVPVTAARVV